jgi:hypothetical protein
MEADLLLLSLIPVGVLVQWSRKSGMLNPWQAAGLSIAGALIMCGCLWLEARWGPNTDDAAGWLAMVGLVPVLEESARGLGVACLGISRVAGGTLLGGVMGITEFLYKTLREPLPPAGVAFILMATIPLHALFGGLLVRGKFFFPVTVLAHAGFNAGVKYQTFVGSTISLCVLWVVFCLWAFAVAEEDSDS